MRAEELARLYAMEAHPENGTFIERHYADNTGKRPASGSIYYFVRPGERTNFHKIDCDEYWIHNAGVTLEIWVVSPNGTLRTERCGTEAGAEPKVFFRAGEIFASRLPSDAPDGTFVTCVTVPRFQSEGFRMYSRGEMERICPESAAFWE